MAIHPRSEARIDTFDVTLARDRDDRHSRPAFGVLEKADRTRRHVPVEIGQAEIQEDQTRKRSRMTSELLKRDELADRSCHRR